MKNAQTKPVIISTVTINGKKMNWFGKNNTETKEMYIETFKKLHREMGLDDLHAYISTSYNMHVENCEVVMQNGIIKTYH